MSKPPLDCVRTAQPLHRPPEPRNTAQQRVLIPQQGDVRNDACARSWQPRNNRHLGSDARRPRAPRALVPTMSWRCRPPASACPSPDGFGATMNEYRDWLAAELEGLLAAGTEHVDLLGHDWGGGHVMRIAMERPDLIRSWCTDVIGLFDRGLRLARRGAALANARRRRIHSAHDQPSRPRANRVSTPTSAWDPRWPNPSCRTSTPTWAGASWRCTATLPSPPWPISASTSPQPARRPGLCILAAGDHFTGGGVMHRRIATRAGARVTELLDVGHWWMCENPGLAAHTVASWLASLDRTGAASGQAPDRPCPAARLAAHSACRALGYCRG